MVKNTIIILYRYTINHSSQWKMCKKITEYRQTTLPDHHLRNTALSSSSHTPNIDSRSDLQNASLSQQVPSLSLSLSLSFFQDCGQRLIQLKETVSRNNAGNIPLLVKRVGECAEGIHKLDSLNTRRTIHPAFRKPRITP
ncbi:unnamed protein product [Brassica oleracea var. botrytis]|uniref:(rape) hypothetical protein n=1 Tax=Brassica napus TaxID=3708 RepID=A0A816IWN8_BRANA|nr:unnamed protein product [Brassica napus]